MKAISAEPGHRYTTAGELQADLDALAKPKTHVLLWIALAVLAVAAAAFGTWYFSSQQKVVVPYVVGKTTAEAGAEFTSAGLKLVISGRVPSAAVGTGTIVAETPAGGQPVRKGAQVGVVVSTGLPLVSIPSLVGVDFSIASKQLADAGLVVGTVSRQNSTVIPAESVISAEPSAGVKVTVGTSVNLVVSTGQATVAMPDVGSIPQASATTKLTSLGLKVDVGRTFSSQPVGTVVSQMPAAGTIVPAGSTVTISVSQGRTPVIVPDVVGATRNVAVSTLQRGGFVPLASTEPTGTHPSRRERVVTQSPGAGALVAPGSQVKLTIGN